MRSNVTRISVMGLAVDALDERGCVEHVAQALDGRRGGWIITANLDHLRRHANDSSYRDLCAEAELVVVDGRPLLWAARVRGTPLPGLVAGSNLITSLTEMASRRQRSIYFLGGDEGTAVEAASALAARFSGLVIAGTHCPEFGFDRDETRVARIAAKLVAAAPDIIYVALGSPKQELLIRRIRHHLPEAWWIGVGISFSFACGRTRRAPVWVQRLGFEWLHRLCQEPRRLFKRYLVQGIPFAVRLSCWALRSRLSGEGAPKLEGASDEQHRRAA